MSEQCKRLSRQFDMLEGRCNVFLWSENNFTVDKRIMVLGLTMTKWSFHSVPEVLVFPLSVVNIIKIWLTVWVVDSKIFHPDLLYCWLWIQPWYWKGIVANLILLFGEQRIHPVFWSLCRIFWDFWEQNKKWKTLYPMIFLQIQFAFLDSSKLLFGEVGRSDL